MNFSTKVALSHISQVTLYFMITIPNAILPWQDLVKVGLTFPETINTIFPETKVQLCVIHQVRNSMKYVAAKNQKEFYD